MASKAAELIQMDSSDAAHFQDISENEFYGYPIDPIIKSEEKLLSKETSSIAYFSMEYGLAPSIYHEFKTGNKTSERNILGQHEVFSNMMQMDYYHYLPIEKTMDLPIYSGGLGVLAGDTLKSAADQGVSLVGIGILWRKGYFRQKFWFRGGGQFPEELSWDPDSYPGLIPLEPSISIDLSGQKLQLRMWKYYVYSYDLKNVVPLILLDADMPENPQYMRELTDQLYRSTNAWIRIAQRVILGIGGVRALESLGYSINKYHLNEGHAAFAFVEKARSAKAEDLKGMFAYTCHTPVEAGHDRFSFQELEAALGSEGTKIVRQFGSDEKNQSMANLTQLAMNTCEHANGVSRKHGEITRLQFPKYKEKIISITNGVHTFTWMSDPIKEVLLKYKDVIGDFEADPTMLANASKLRSDKVFRQQLFDAHIKNKESLAEFLKAWYFDRETFTIAWARRFANYKRPTLILQDINKIINIAKNVGPLQIIIAGKAHPADGSAAEQMDIMMEKINLLCGYRKILRVCFLENYDTYFAKLLTSSVDVWLNNPLPPFEASGTSGMKAIINGVLQLSTLDGWIVEAADKNIGTIFGYVAPDGEIGSESDLKLDQDSKALYKNLESMMSLYYDTIKGRVKIEDSQWIDKMINCIEQSAYFSTHRMVREYKELIWDK
jgi:starch phosphorylase